MWLTSKKFMNCAGLTQPYPKKNLFAISVAPPSATSAAPLQGVLCVRGVRMAEPYDEKTFVYRIGESAFVA